MAGELAPSVSGHLAIFGIQAHDDVATKGGAGVLQKTWVFHRGGANNDVAQAGIQITLDGVQVTDATAELHINLAAHFLEDLADGRLVLGFTGKGAVEVDQVQAAGTLAQPAARHGRWIFSEMGGLIHIALLEAHTLAVF
jgi:hypothetical protein